MATMTHHYTDEELSAWERIKRAFANDWEQTKSDFGSKTARDMDQDVDDTVKQMAGADDAFENREQAFRFINGLTLFKSAVSLGGTESLICHPASTTHSGVPVEARAAAGVSEGLIRMSVGLEHPDDLIADLSNALEQC